METNKRHSPARIRLYLPSVQTSLSGEQVLSDPVLAALVIEDMCWSFARDDWISREPYRWQRRKKERWQAEYRALCDQREEIRCLARHCGLLRG